MLISLLTLLLISNALTLRKDKSILFSRIVMVSLILTSFLAYNNLFFLPLDKGIGIFGGLFHVNFFTQIFNIFIYLISAVILALTSFYPRKVFLNQISSFLTSLPLIVGGLIFLAFRLPFKILLIALDWELYYIIVSFFSAILFASVLALLKDGEILKGAKLITIGFSCLIVTVLFSFLFEHTAEITHGFLCFTFTSLNLAWLGDINTLFSSSRNGPSSLPGLEQESNISYNDVPQNFNYQLFAQAFKEKAEVVILERQLGINADRLRDKTVTLLELGISENSPYYSVLKKFAAEYKGDNSVVKSFCTSIHIDRPIKVKIYDNSPYIGSKIFDAISKHK